MFSEIITKENHCSIYEWLCECVCHYKGNEDYQKRFRYDGNFINVDACCTLREDISMLNILYPFGYVSLDFRILRLSNLQLLVNCPHTVGGTFDCLRCPSLISLEGCPKRVGGSFSVLECRNIENINTNIEEIGNSFNIGGSNNRLKSLIGFPIITRGEVCYGTSHNKFFSCTPIYKKEYNIYIDLWFEILENVTDEIKFEYLSNYGNKLDYDYEQPIIPKEVINKYKIDFLLK